MGRLQVLYLLWILPFIGAEWQDIVERECQGASNAEIFLKTGHVYKYHYVASGSAAAVGTSDKSSEIDIECSVTVSHAVGCLYNLDLSNCKVHAKGGPEGQEQHWIHDRELSVLSEHSVLFTLNNGELGSVFAHPEDPTFSVNIKRGVISGFGISGSADATERLHRDVHGTCPWVTYILDSTHIESHKEMHRCAYPSRPDWNLSPFSLFWNMTFMQYLVNSSTECEYTLNAGKDQLKKVSCHERHASLFDSSQDTANSKQTNIKYLLELEQANTVLFKHRYRLNELRQTGIEFEYDKTREPTSQPPDFLNKAQKLLSDLVKVSEDHVQVQTVPLFQNFIDLLRTSTDLIPFIDSVTSCSFLENVKRCSKLQKVIALNYLKDAIVHCNTASCMKGFRHLVVREQISRIHLSLVLLSWTNIHVSSPAYVEEILAICKHTEMKLCWLTLGTVIYKCSQEHAKIPQAVKDTVSHLSKYISDDCNVEDVTFPAEYTTEDKNEYLLTVLKTIGNIGDVARGSHHGIIRQLYSCAAGKDVSTEISVAAIKAMHKMKPNSYINKKLLFLLKDSSRSIAVRINSYDILLSMFDDDELKKEIAVLLREEKNSQVKCYIASDVKLRLNEDDPSDKESFAHKLTEKFKEEGVYLEDIECNTKFYSHARKGSSFFNLNFLPKEIQGFGSEWNSKVIFDTLSAFPYSFSLNYTTELFSKYYNLFEVGSSSKNWEEFAIWIRRQLADPDINISQWLMTNFLKIIRRLGIKGLIPIIPGTESEEPEFVYPDQKIADNFKKVVKQFLDANVKQKPYLEMYLKTHGNELGYLSLNGIFSFLTKQYHWLSNQNIEESLRKGITYNSTRSLRVLEGYYHVPTIAGLPLTWSTNLTYILSPRVTVDAVTSTGERTENFDIRYSESFSVISRMTLELPTVTQVGVQTNTSGHAALEYVFTLTHSDAKYLHEITLQRPSSDQKYFEYYRINQQIQHDQYEDLPDGGDAERKDEEWCSSELSNEVTGFRMCRRLSYPLLPLNKRLSTFLSGPITSSYIVEPYDRDLHYYKLTIIRPPTNKNEYDVKIRFKAPGTKYSRELSVDVQLDTVKREGTLKVAAADLPDFVISASRASFRNEDGAEMGAEQHWLIQLTKDKKYELKHVYNEETKQEARHRRSSRNKEFLATNRERTIDLETPHNKYHWSSKVHSHKDALKVEALVTYENLEDSWNWGGSIFPKTLWETDKKAWLNYEGEWEVDFDRTSPDHFHRHMVSTLRSPKRSAQILTHRMHMPARVQLYANATVTDAETGKYLTFLNCSYNIWKNKDGRKLHDIHSGRIEIPRYTWTTHLERDISDEARFVTLTLARTKLSPLNEEGEKYRGGLDQAQRDNFDIEEVAVKYVGNIQFKKVENRLLPQKLLEIEHFRNKNERFPGIESKIDLSLTFPFNGKDESITIKGEGIGLYKEIPSKFNSKWFDSEGSEMTLVGHSTVTNMKREIHTVTGSRHNWIKKLILHRDSIYHNDERQSEYNLNLLWGEKQKCEYFDLKHSFTSSFYEFDSDVLLECEAQTKAYRLEMNINTKSPEWDVLNSKTHQIFYLQRHLEGYEIMNFTNPYLKIDAEGKIGMDFEGPFYDKKYSIKSQNDIIPSAEITYNTKFSATPFSETVLLAPEEGLKKATWRTDLARDGSGLTMTGKHIHVGSPDEEHQHSSVTLKFLSPYKFTIKGYEDLRVTWAVAEWIQGRLDVISQKIATITRNDNHPVMRLFRSFVKPYEKWEKELGRVQEEALRNRREINQLLYPFIEPTVEFLENLGRESIEMADHADDNYEVYSLSSHLAERYRIQTRAEEFIVASPQILLELLKSYIATQDNHILKFEYTGNHLVRWPSLFEAPETWEGTWRLPAFHYLPYLNKEILFSQRYMVMPYHKTAMIFGPLHIYTFDGKFYEFIDYPIPDCTYMLAHDVRDSSFSILTSSNKLHLMFPEITLTLVSDGKIYVNNSRQQSATPIESYNRKVAVTREGTIVAVDSMGLKVVCDVPRMFCIFVLDSLHHSGTMGLLGNADGEALNDFSLPDGKHVETSAEMARGYEVSNRKKCRNVQEKEKPEWTRDIKTRCSSQFTKELTNCAAYLEIDENDFKEACRWDVSKEKDVCFSVDALAGYCTVHGMKTIPCSSKHDWNLKNVHPAQKLEVVLVIDEYSTMFPKGLEGLESLLGAVEEEFIENGYNSILYSVVGFGGKGVRAKPHIETPDAYIWHNQKETVSGMKQTVQFNGNSRADAFDAIKYAATILPFDLESSRIMLLFTVDDDSSYFSGLKVTYLQGLLDSYSLTLYTFADFPSIDKGKKVFGLTADGVIFPKGRKAESYIDLPTTEKAKLTAATHGAIFLRRFAEANEPYAFFKIAAEEFAAKVKKEASKCRICSWTLNHWWDVQNQCHVTDECRDQ